MWEMTGALTWARLGPFHVLLPVVRGVLREGVSSPVVPVMECRLLVQAVWGSQSLPWVPGVQGLCLLLQAAARGVMGMRVARW